MDSGFLKRIAKDESVMISNFDAAQRLLNHGKHNLNLNYPEFRQKMDLFFIDYDMIPILMQESYLNSMGDRRDMQSIEAMASAADYISMGDQVSI
jgi:replication factor C subunit 1